MVLAGIPIAVRLAMATFKMATSIRERHFELVEGHGLALQKGWLDGVLGYEYRVYLRFQPNTTIHSGFVAGTVATARKAALLAHNVHVG